jgi:hypothetical protein
MKSEFRELSRGHGRGGGDFETVEGAQMDENTDRAV